YSLSIDPLGGLTYGAVGGMISAGYDNANSAYDEVALLANGTIDWPATAVYGMSADTKLYTYLEGCSDSGRQGMSQVQRWGGEYDDGAITGAPAFRYGQQQTAHMFPVVVEQTLNYYPPPCELDQIVTAIIAACDPLNGRTDGVIFLAQIYVHSNSIFTQFSDNLTTVLPKIPHTLVLVSESGRLPVARLLTNQRKM
ncbi:hypothetical protein ACHAO1_011290, partial [Botrytis cinerea]